MAAPILFCEAPAIRTVFGDVPRKLLVKFSIDEPTLKGHNEGNRLNLKGEQ